MTIGYLKGFDIKGMSDYIDYFNFMSYDIHGTWDGNSEYTSSVVNPHTNLTGMFTIHKALLAMGCQHGFHNSETLYR